MKSSRKSTDLTVNTHYLDFGRILVSTSYVHSYIIILVNDEDNQWFTSLGVSSRRYGVFGRALSQITKRIEGPVAVRFSRVLLTVQLPHEGGSLWRNVKNSLLRSRGHEEMEIFIKNHQRSFCLKERSNLLSELKIKEEPHDVGMKNKSSSIPERTTQPLVKPLRNIYFSSSKDLGASISLMPYTMYEKLGLGEPKPTRISLKLADRSIHYPRGLVENVLIKVATDRAMIDVFNKKITFRIGYDEVIFNMDQSIKIPPTEDEEWHGIDDLDNTINIETQELLEND
ncbi:putative laccase [Tanacetum coccineum]